MRCHRLCRTPQLALVAILFVLGGCAGGLPKSADEFREFTAQREKVLGPIAVPKETFEVERPFKDVSSTLQKKADECLRVVLTGTYTNKYGNTFTSTTTFKPTFIASARRAEVHVQQKRSAVVEVGAPPDGTYRVVLDATPIAAKRTRIDIYAMSVDDKLLRQTLRGWAQGSNLGCPDLTKR